MFRRRDASHVETPSIAERNYIRGDDEHIRRDDDERSFYYRPSPGEIEEMKYDLAEFKNCIVFLGNSSVDIGHGQIVTECSLFGSWPWIINVFDIIDHYPKWFFDKYISYNMIYTSFKKYHNKII